MNKLRKYLNSIPIQEQSFFARKCGTTINYLRKRLSSKEGKLGLNICIEIEDKTKGEIRCEDLRPDVNWSILRNKKATNAN